MKPVHKSPAEQTRDMIDEVLFWHRAHGEDVTYAKLFHKTRKQNVVNARGDVMRRLRFDRDWTLPRIAEFFGMDHTTVLHHVTRKDVATRPLTLEQIGSTPEGRQHLKELRAIEWQNKWGPLNKLRKLSKVERDNARRRSDRAIDVRVRFSNAAE